MQILDLHVLELDPLNFDLFFFFDFSPAKKGAFHQIVKKSPTLPYKNVFCFLKGYKSVIFACGAHGLESAVPGHAAVPTHTCSTSIKAVLSKHEGTGQKTYRNLACIMPGCTG